MGKLSLNNGVWTLGDDESFSPVSMNVIDLTDTSTWTLLEPDAMTYNSVGTDGSGVTTFIFDALGTGNAKYSFSGANAEWPRHYANLNDSNGTRLTTNDAFLLAVRLSSFSNPPNNDFRIAVGCCVSPTSILTTDFDGYGIGMRMDATQHDGLQVYLDSTSGNAVGFSPDTSDTIYGVVTRTAERHASNTVFGEASDASIASAQYTVKSSTAISTGQNWSLFVASSMFANLGTINAAESFALKLEYQVIRLR